MLQVATDLGAGVADAVREAHLSAYRFMLRARLLDDKCAALYRAGKIQGGVFLGRGQEALSAATGITLKKNDIFAPLIRDTAGRLAFGEPILDAVRTYMGSALGPMRGRDGNVHRGNLKLGQLAMISHLGAMVSVVNGMLLARRLKEISGAVGVACLGDGATSTGAFHEALNQAAVERLPLVLIVANNQFAYSTPTCRQFACADLADKAAGYGVEAHSLDGTDLTACLRTISGAIALARSGEGPQLVVASLLRLCGHGEHDDASYITPEMKNSSMGRDCLNLAREKLLAERWTNPAQLKAWQAEALHEIESAINQVQREPAPDPRAEKWRAISTEHLIDGNETTG
jgi:pyruvate dehydrogenase E1 component alpha subunit/2-oxoisovalerate dehydrogenase E1 component alpha subunit